MKQPHHHHDNHDHVEAAGSSFQASGNVCPVLLSSVPDTEPSKVSFQSSDIQARSQKLIDPGFINDDILPSSYSSIIVTEHISLPSSSESPFNSQNKAKSLLKAIKSSIKKINIKSSKYLTSITRRQELLDARGHQPFEDINITDDDHPVIQAFREEQLGRNIFLLAVPIATGFMAYYNPASMTLAGRLAAVALSIGSAAIWNGILLRKACPKASNASELLGVALMLVAFFGYIGSRLPKRYLWLPLLCIISCHVPLAVALCRGKKNNACESGRQDDVVPAA